MSTTEHDVVVVGSGASGGAAAWRLTRAGLRTLVLEKGPFLTEPYFIHDELTLCRRPFFTPDPLHEPNIVVDGGVERATTDGWIACCVGGGTVVMGGYFFRMQPDDLRARTRFGPVAGADIVDWPIEWSELEPFYDEVEQLIGVSGVAPPGAPTVPRRLETAMATHGAAELIDEAARRMGLAPFQTPRAIITSPRAGRSACHYCGFCGSYGCEVGAKSSAAVTFIPAALATGRLDLRPSANAVRVLASGGRVRGVEWRDADGTAHEARARVVVLAASAIQSARLLLLSEIANRSGLVGKNLWFATLSAASARFAPSERLPATRWDFPFLDRALADFYVAPDRGLPYPKAGTIVYQLPHWNPIYAATRAARGDAGAPPLFGEALSQRLRDLFRNERWIDVETFAEFLPNAGTHVALDPTRRDPNGLPVARVTVAVHPHSLAASDFLLERGTEVLSAAGALEVRRVEDARVYWPLQAGTARMGHDPERSVLDPTGQTHDVKNLYVADASGFPSGGSAPFTLTIMANACRIADRIAARGARGEL